jgi:2-oxoglutarate ferredoxin oxidoreductase subunit alpha
MTRLRAEKVERVARSIPPLEVYGDAQGDLLVIGWGSTRGAIEAAVDQVTDEGLSVGSIHLRYLNPFPSDLPEVLSRFEHLLVPEINDGQLVRVLRDRFLLPFIPLNKIQGQPFKATEIAAKIRGMLK